MRQHQVIAAALLVSLLPGWSLRAAPLKFRSEHVTLPDDARQFSGKNSDAINNNCLACHSVDMVLNQPSFPRATWDAEVHKMMAVYKAPVALQDVDQIVDYLCSLKCPRQ